jgi:copper(I)-binding protein
MKILTATVLLGLCVTNPVGAAEYKAGSIRIENPWSRATPKGATTGAGYMIIKNTGTEPDRLIGGTTDVSAGLQIHEMTTEGSVSKMREMKLGVEIKPGETVELRPGSSHVMFVNLKRKLEKGERVKGTLTFERAGTVAVEYPVQAVGVRGAEGGGEHMHHQH